MVIDHIGIAVKSIHMGIQQWVSNFGYRQMTKIVENTRQKVNVVFLEKPDSIIIKLIEPTDKESPIFKFAMRGGGLHHLCFRCSDLKSTITTLKNDGLRILSAPQPGEAFEEELIAFLLARNGLNIELIETKKKAKLL